MDNKQKAAIAGFVVILAVAIYFYFMSPPSPHEVLVQHIRHDSTIVKVCLNNNYIVKYDNQYYVQWIHDGNDVVGSIGPSIDLATICAVR